jgi:ComF family protein
VHALKYDGWAELAVEMGRDMAAVTLPEEASGEGSVVVPVPTTAKRVAQRGYNQAALLAGSVSRALGKPLVSGLRRPREGTTQVALHPSERRANVRGAFVPKPDIGGVLDGAHVVLVDDVLTTGSTAVAAASALSELGASGVTLVTFARALPFRRTGSD